MRDPMTEDGKGLLWIPRFEHNKVGYTITIKGSNFQCKMLIGQQIGFEGLLSNHVSWGLRETSESSKFPILLNFVQFLPYLTRDLFSYHRCFL